jgi:hypothetical protein
VLFLAFSIRTIFRVLVVPTTPDADVSFRGKAASMISKTKVLVFPCGSENASEIHQALRYSVHVDLYGASSVEDHGRFRFEQYVGGLPNIGDPAFDGPFADLIRTLKIDMVFATHDSVQEYLATRASQMKFYLVNGDPKTAAIARRKSATYGLFSDCGWVPQVFESIEEVKEWPIIIKPNLGQGGQGVALVRGPSEAANVLSTIAEPILVEYLPGDEITIDCFSDLHQELIWVGPRTRERIRGGITMRSTLLDLTSEIATIAETINERLRLRGPWFFQLRADRCHKWKLLEVSCRVAGAMAAQRARGINLPLMAVQDYLGRRLIALPNPQIKLIERNIATRAELEFHYHTVFVDLDDTLIIDGFASPLVLAFLYQSVRDGKQIKLITRHALDVAQALRRARIADDLFDEIIHLGADAAKSDYVTQEAILIDNHFPERLAVARARAIPVFDVDALEFFVR